MMISLFSLRGGIAFTLGLWVSWAGAQVESETRRSMTIHRRPVTVPPQLEMDAADFVFEDDNGNGFIDANEEARLLFTVKNAPTARGIAKGLSCRISLDGATQGILIPEVIPMADIPIGASMEFSVPIASERGTKDGELEVRLRIQEPNGMGPAEKTANIKTLAYRKPEVIKAEQRVLEGKILRGQVFTYQFLLRNVGEGFAYDVRAELELPDELVMAVSTPSFKFDMMEPGSLQELGVQVIVPPAYPLDEVQFKVVVHESSSRNGETFLSSMDVEQNLDDVVWEAPSTDWGDKGSAKGKTSFYKSDVDMDIPNVGRENKKRFALVIGNQQYARYNPGFTESPDVPYAEADAEVFARYLQGMWGLPEKNILLVLNANKTEFSKNVTKLANFAAAYGEGDAELIFYYSGHGLPSESTREPFLIPVDVNGNEPETGVALEMIMEALRQFPTQRITIFLDACFSGGARGGSLIAGNKGIARAPETVDASGRMVVFSSSTDNQSSGVYEEGEHGYFTYFLLKYMKENKGKVTYGEMFDYVKREVGLQSNMDDKPQNPSVHFARDVEFEWRDWGLND